MNTLSIPPRITKFNAAEALVDGRGLSDAWGSPAAVALLGAALVRAREQVLGDGPQWLEAIAALERRGPAVWSCGRAAPELRSNPLASSEVPPPAGSGRQQELAAAASREVKEELLRLSPWRKGPFRVFDVDLDAEWRCDRKWARLQNAVDLSNKSVFDVGCGNGYYLLRALGDGARAALGIDPTWLYVAQFSALRRLAHPATAPFEAGPAPSLPAWVLPLALEDLPKDLPLQADVVFSMGVLYHRKSPIEHLEALRQRIAPGGTLVLETLIVPGDATTVFTPRDRYAAMRNVWMIPSVEAATIWLRRSGYDDVTLVNVGPTSIEEQRRSEFMSSASLADFLDPADPSLTVEGYPAPQRAILVARRR